MMPTAKDMKLYTTIPLSLPVRKVQTLLMVANIKCEEVFVDLIKGEQMTEKFAKVMPTKKVPTLCDGEFTIFESNAILRYLATKYAPTFYPTDITERTKVDMAMEWMKSTVEQSAFEFTYNKYVTQCVGMPMDTKIIEKALTDVVSTFKTMEDLFWTDGKFVTGTTMTIADICLYTFVKQFDLPGAEVVVMKDFTKLTTWMTMMDTMTEFKTVEEKLTKPLMEVPDMVMKIVKERAVAMKE
eukprot:41462_1